MKKIYYQVQFSEPRGEGTWEEWTDWTFGDNTNRMIALSVMHKAQLTQPHYRFRVVHRTVVERVAASGKNIAWSGWCPILQKRVTTF